LADERAKTAKMHDKLLQSKAEIENASKIIDRLNSEKKAQKQKIKNKNSVLLQ
jgi:ubiquitin